MDSHGSSLTRRSVVPFDAAFDATPAPAVLVAVDGSCLALNAAARELFMAAPTGESIETLTVESEDPERPSAAVLQDVVETVMGRARDVSLTLVRGAAPADARSRIRFEARGRRAPLGSRRMGVALAITSLIEDTPEAAPEPKKPSGRRVRLKTERAAAAETRALFTDRLRRVDAAERLLLIGAGVGLWEEVDPSEGAQIWSSELRALLGRDDAEAPASRDALIALAAPEDRVALAQAFDDAWTAGGLRLEARFIVDGAPRWFLLTGRAADAADGQRRGLVGSMVDIDDRVRLETRLAEANAELERFAIVAAHDLQAPLRKIALQSDLLDRGVQQARATIESGAAPDLSPIAAPIAAMRANAKRMRRSINDLLARAKGGADALEIAPLSLRALVAEVSEPLSAVIEDCSAKIVVTGDDAFRSDGALIAHTIQNLISNALKYRSETPPHVSIAGRRDGERFEISVSDNGVGFDHAAADRIFNMSERLPETSGREGDGVGLAFCRRVARRLGGDIAADGRPGDGATFTLRLPDGGAPAHAAEAG